MQASVSGEIGKLCQVSVALRDLWGGEALREIFISFRTRTGKTKNQHFFLQNQVRHIKKILYLYQ